jgi:hypothetical protein
MGSADGAIQKARSLVFAAAGEPADQLIDTHEQDPQKTKRMKGLGVFTPSVVPRTSIAVVAEDEAAPRISR